MRIRRPDWAVCRAVIAVAALYALALQAMLGGMIGVRTVDPAHVLCLQEGGTAQPGPADAHAHHAMTCCTAPQAAPVLEAPGAAAVVRPLRPVVRMAWRPEIVATPRGPPRIGAGARAPPIA